MDAFLDGIDLARATGQDLSRIAAVGSMFVSRVDTEIDRRLDAIGPVEANVLGGTAATGNARPAFQAVVVMAALSRTAASPTTNRGIAYDETLRKLERDGPDDVPDVPGCAHRHS